MTSIEVIREAIATHFQRVQDIGNGVLRGELCHNETPYAVTYIDLSDDVVQRSSNLNGFQEDLLGAEFFSAEGDMRWNSYLYFFAGPKSIASKEFAKAKARIEADRHFARKFVLEADDLVLRLRDSVSSDSPEPAQLADAGATWAALLAEASLSSLLEQLPRTTALEQIASGEAFKAEVVQPKSKSAPKVDALAKGRLRNLKVGSFRKAIQGKCFEFGDVNLIVGANGTGKTSLLEAIEALYCSRVRRDPDAPFSDIIGALDNGQRKLETVKAPTTIAALKARNTLWYGRTDYQSTAISEGFSRFNFLDTDAAFRLSSDADPGDIKEDLAKLLVGPETSRLWDYLSKLCYEVAARLRSISERLPGENQTVELLEAEVRRFREAPSAANTLISAYRTNLARLAPEWMVQSSTNTLTGTERERLEELIRTTRRIQSAVSETPVTLEKVARRLSRLRQIVSAVKELHQRHESALKRGAEARLRLKTVEVQKAQLENWQLILEAGVPALASSIREAEQRVSRLRRLLQDQPAESVLTIDPEYASLDIADARTLAGTKLTAAQGDETVAEHALSESIRQGQSLEALRRDLHDAATAYIERSGEGAVCPVCKTEHSPRELIAKVDALIAFQGTVATESLRRNAQLAREQMARCRQNESLVNVLEKFSEVSRSGAETSCGKLLDDLRTTIADMTAASGDLRSLRNALSQLNLQGLDWSGWESTRDSAIVPLLPPGVDPTSRTAITAAQGLLDEQARNDIHAEKDEKAQGEALLQQIRAQIAEELNELPQNMDSAQQVATAERVVQQAEVALLELKELAAILKMSPSASVEELQVELVSCLMAFDQAQHAVQADTRAREDLEKKSIDLKTATAKLAADTSAHGNLLRASKALSQLVDQHSLERATAIAFEAIKQKVSEVFAKIHSPQEYELGDFTSGSLIIRRENGQVHDVNQVSTGQRAAFALSIFLALNDSAKSAPPIILIDDPVAHVDDLNTLSFLDYLREVALRSRKQIFFATADIRLAALFQRKFEFMGKEHYKRISLPVPMESF